MRHKYFTPALVLARAPFSEASALVTMVTPEFGVLRARAQGLRKPGAKMGAGLQTFSESDVSLVRGKEGWRATGAVLAKNWAASLDASSRARAGRVAELALRLTHGESMDAGPALFSILTSYLLVLTDATLSEEERDAAELLAVLRILNVLGLNGGDILGREDSFDAETLARVLADRKGILARVNHGIAASGL